MLDQIDSRIKTFSFSPPGETARQRELRESIRGAYVEAGRVVRSEYGVR